MGRWLKLTGKMFNGDGSQLRDWLKLNKDIEEIAEDQVPCRNDPDGFFIEYSTTTNRSAGGNANYAKNACRMCPVMAQCAEYAITHREEYGIWGGTSPAERKAIWKGKVNA